MFYESPALIGCALAVHRELYDDLCGFDPHMRSWGVEDLDFGLKCWLMGHPILHDPEAIVAHRFRKQFDNFSVPVEHLLLNQLRMARKHFTQAVWAEWLERCRMRHSGRLAEHPEGLWACAWQLLEERRASVESERSHLMSRRTRDEFWYAERFGLAWPRLSAERFEPLSMTLGVVSEGSPEPSPSPPPCMLDPQEEEWWDEVKGIAVPTISFWVNWLREDDQNDCPDLLVCIIRAISWVESRHGHGTGNHANRDPMQVGNPNDSAWKNIGINDSNGLGDRPVRQGSLPGLSWKDIPANVNQIINPTPPPDPPVLPYAIDPTFLPANGHQNNDFTKQMSYFGLLPFF